MRFWWRLALYCGLPHPDLLLAVLNARQMTEIQVYAGIEPISWDSGVSMPVKEKEKKAMPPEVLESKIDAILGNYNEDRRQKTGDRRK